MFWRCLIVSLLGASLIVLTEGRQFATVDDINFDVQKRSARFEVGARIIARWTNNKYYRGRVSSMRSGNLVDILFDDGDKITHSTHDVSAVIPDHAPYEVHLGQHVIATLKGGHKFFIGFISGKDAANRWKVTFDDNDEDFYVASQLRVFVNHYSPHEVGSRVLARWTNGLYYRGFVTKTTHSTVFIRLDDGDTITLNKLDCLAVILDKLPCYQDLYHGTRVIGFWPGKVMFYPGVVTVKKDTGRGSCIQHGAYDVKFDDGDRRVEDFHQLRRVPCMG